MAVVPTPPYKVQMLSGDGFLSQAWLSWFREVYIRIGGTSALSNTELAGTITSTVSTQISDLQNAVSELQTETSQLSDFNLEPAP